MFRAPQMQEDVDPDSGFPRNIFHIPDVNFEKFKKQMASLSKRSERLLGKPIHALPFGYKTMDLGGVKRKVYNVILTAEIPRVAGWTFVARLDHSNETGTIIRSVPNVGGAIPERFRQSAPVCEHCNVARRRRDTFLLRCDETGDFKQVGSTCLVDFFEGNDPVKIAKMAEYLGYAMEAAIGAGMLEEGGMADLRWIDVEEFLAHCAAMIRKFGWVSAAEARERGDEVRSTRARAMDNMVYATTRNIHPVTDEDRALAAEALEWARGLEAKARLSEWEHNVLVIANAEMMEHRSCGLAASIMGVHIRNKARPVPTERPDYSGSQHVAQPGERLRDVPVKLVGHRTIVSDFGVSFLHRFLTAEGNVLVWFATQNVGLVEGQEAKLTGTVKRHETRDGVKQTILSRCKVIT